MTNNDEGHPSTLTVMEQTLPESHQKSSGPGRTRPATMRLLLPGIRLPPWREVGMSVRMMAKVWELDLPQPLKLLALAMADFADDAGDGIFPSIEYIAWKVGATERTIQRQLRILEGSGVLKVVAIKGVRHPNGRWTRLWAIHPEMGDKLTPLVRASSGDATGAKRKRLGRHSSGTQSVRYPLENRAFEIEEPEIPRLPGESHKDYMLRVAWLIPGLDK